MIKPGNFVAVLDACVLYKANVRDLLLRTAKNELYQPRWSYKICEEVSNNLIINGAATPEKAQKLIDVMNKAFPESLIDNYIDIIDLKIEEINDKDRHVIAAAIVSNSQVIITDNIKHFPNVILEKYSLEAQTSDEFLENLLDLSPEGVIDSFTEMERLLKNPPLSRDMILKGLSKQVPVFTEQLKELLFTKTELIEKI